MAKHNYQVRIEWTGNRGEGTAHYLAYGRDHTIKINGKADLAASADPMFRGDSSRHNPEELLVAALSACHMLWYLHLCADAGIVVESYEDDAEGAMELDADGGGRFTEVLLKPRVKIKTPEKKALAESLHDEAHRKCFIANSCNFPVRHSGEIDGDKKRAY